MVQFELEVTSANGNTTTVLVNAEVAMYSVVAIIHDVQRDDDLDWIPGTDAKYFKSVTIRPKVS